MDRSQPVSLATPRIDTPSQSGTDALGGSEAFEFQQQVQQGNLAGLREYLARTRADRDWQDRIFILNLIVPSIRFAALDFACDTEPQAPDLFLIRCAFFNNRASEARGSGTCDKVEEGRFQNAGECIQQALAALQRVETLDPQDPTPYACVLPSLTIFGETQPHQLNAFQKATALAPDLVPPYRAIVNSLSERWHGSHQKSLDFARHAMTKAGAGSDMAVCLFWAHMLVKTYISGFDKKPEAAKEYARKPEVAKELEDAFDSWTNPPYSPRRSSIPYLHFAAVWFYLVEDRARLQRALSLTNNVFDKTAWSWAGNAEKAYERALLIAAGQNPPPVQKKQRWEDALGFILHGARVTQEGRFSEAEKILVMAMALAKSAPEEEAAHFIPLIVLNHSWLLQKWGKLDASKKAREQATALLDADSNLTESAKYPNETAEVLQRLGEFSRAIPFWEQAIESHERDSDPAALAEILQKIGSCYSGMGLHEHAAVPLRTALKIHRSSPGDPRLAAILVNLGNATRKTSPTEAEALYSEAADLHVAKLRYESATTAWVNLGILCSEQGRHAESLEHYQRVLHIREQTKGTKPSSIASVPNNMAGNYLRMGKYAEAHKSIDKAIKLLSSSDALLLRAYDTRGKIFQASGDDKEAVEWFRNAIAECKKCPSPDLTLLIEYLENLIESLRRLDRSKEVAAAEEEIASVRASAEAVPEVNASLTTVKGESEGAVLIELAFDSRPILMVRRVNTTHLAHKLRDAVEAKNLGRYRGWVAIPESTTLFFYGPDAEALFNAIEPALKTDPLSSGARVVIRQGGTHREAFVAQQPTRVN